MPVFLLRRWAYERSPGQLRLPAFYWDNRRAKLREFPAGFDQICCRDGLFAFEGDHPSGRDAIETGFFKQIDDAAAKVVSKILDNAAVLSAEDRAALIPFLLSLDARRPENVKQLLTVASRRYRQGLNSDLDIVETVRASGEARTPSEIWEAYTGHTLEDHAMLHLQSITHGPGSTASLMAWPWLVVRFKEGGLALSDRPLIRILGRDHPRTLWALPLSPSVALFASPSAEVLQSIQHGPEHRVRKDLNTAGADQADRYVMVSASANLAWLSKRLSNPHRKTGPELIEALEELLLQQGRNKS